MRRSIHLSLLVSLVAVTLHSPAGARSVRDELYAITRDVDAASVPSRIFYDRVLPLSGIERFDGSASAAAGTAADWRQIYFEMQGASLRGAIGPPLAELRETARASERRGVIPIAVVNMTYDRLRADALEDGSARMEAGRLQLVAPSALTQQRAFAAAALVEHTHHGVEVEFELDETLYFSNDVRRVSRIELNLGDGRGARDAAFGGRYAAHYASTGTKRISIRFVMADGEVLSAAFVLEVQALQAPAPDDTISVMGQVPYNGFVAFGEAYVYLADGHAQLTRPVILVEGFDLDNSMNWEELYTLLNRENLVETIRSLGMDIVVLNFNDATDLVQRNSFVTMELIQQVEAMIGPSQNIAVVGASMGGLCLRYALAYMEMNSIPHRVQTFISFDVPHRGANIPLGVQWWLDFFDSESSEAAFLLSRLDRPAARQQLVYHHSAPPSPGTPDALRPVLESELTALGEYPSQPRNVAIANGSATMLSQGFLPGEQIVAWVYNTTFVDILGNVWAVPSGPSTRILEAEIWVFLLQDDQLNIFTTGPTPYDSAPGGRRNSMEQMAAVPAPYGDITALHPNHCFVPTISALDVNTSDVFYDIAGDSNLLANTPFDAVYYQTFNQDHVAVTPENAQWFISELLPLVTAVAGDDTPSVRVRLLPNVPNPFNPSTRIRFEVDRPLDVRLTIHDVRGARVVTLLDEPVPAGTREVTWDGMSRDGRRMASGVYFSRLEAGGEVRTRKLVLLK